MHTDAVSHDPNELVAIVGMAGRFPGAADTRGLWRLLTERGHAIRPVPPERWDTTAQLDPEKEIQSVGGFIDGVDRFDPAFFGISPREVEDIDPQQRLILEAGWQALEDAGVRAEDVRGSRTGVYVGALWHDYELLRKDTVGGASQRSAVGHAIDVISARLSYVLGLQGPSLSVATGCSSSLVALHLAVQALRQGEIDAALVGGVNLILTPDVSIGLTHFGGLSPDGRCAAFAESANGFVRGEGVAAVYVKTLARALADGDRIHAVIVRTAVNNDGGGDSLVTPSPEAQEDLLRRVYRDGGVPLDKLAYVEAHGTGTRRGDPVEAGAIGRAIGQRRDSAHPIAVGSIKSNIGHLEAASGLAGLFKVVLSLENGVVPPSLHAERLSSRIPFDELNVRVVREPLPLPEDGPVYMGVNSFGWGGTNAHAVLMTAPPTGAAAAPAAPAPEAADRPVVVPLSGHNEQALRDRAAGLAELISAAPAAPDLTELAGTLAHRRDSFPSRAAVVARSTAELATALERFAADPAAETPGVVTGRADTAAGRTAFVFPGQGSQWAGMGAELYASRPVFAEVVHRCAEALAPYVDWDLVEVVSGKAGDGWLQRLDMVQPTLWAVSLGIAELWREAGVEPDVVIGHSQGEVTAATLAGILSYRDAAMIMARRSAIARRVSGRGRMLAVDLSMEAAREALAGFEELVSLAVNNGPTSCVLSGDTEAVEALKEILEAEGVFCRMVNVDYASHSPQMDELREDLTEALADVRPRAGRIPLMSTVRVERLDGPELDTAYWVENLRRPVLFADALGELLDSGVTHVVEISPHPVLSPAIEQLAGAREPRPAVLTSLRREAGSELDLATAHARAFTAGLAPFADLPRAFAEVPQYPWQRESYWLDTSRRPAGRTGTEFHLEPAVTEQDTWHATLDLSADTAPWLADHKVDDAVVLPGTAMLAHAVAAARSRHGALPAALTDVEFLSDLTIGDRPAHLGALWRDDLAQGGTFTLLSLPEGADGWTTHATVRAGWQTPVSEAADFPSELLAAEAVATEAFYAATAARGLPYGPAFQGVQALHSEGDRALARVELSKRCRAGARPYGLHPALWDGALQTVLPLCAGEGLVVPVGVRRVELLGDFEQTVTELWAYAVQREDHLFDLYLYDLGRQPLLAMHGLRMRPLEPAGRAGEETEREYRLRFAEEARPEPAAAPGRWLVVGAGAPAEELAAALAAAGARAAVGTPGDVAGDESDGVVYLAPDAAAGLDAQRAALNTVAELVRAATARSAVPRLAVVTAAAQAVDPADAPDPGAALFWGFTRVVHREHPELEALLLDVLPGEDGWAAECAAELLAGDGEDQVALRSGRRLVARLVPGAPGYDEPAPTAGWRPTEQPFRLAVGRGGRWDEVGFRPLGRRAPGEGEVELAVTAAGLNFIDVMKAMGTYPDRSGGAGLLGGECVGRVTALGAGVTGLAVGDRVAACVMGSLASHVTLRADHVQPVPDGVSDADAAGLPLVLGTAWYALNDLARLAGGETVLVHSAAGGLGLAAVQVARALGARVIATAGTEEKREYLRGLGIEHVFDSRDLSWAPGVRAATGGRGVDVVLNSLTGAAIPLGLEVLAEDGRFIEVGKKDIYGARNLGLSEFRKSLSFASVDLAGLLDRRPEKFARLFADVWRLVADGRITPLPRLGHDFADAAEALREMSHGRHIGKFVLERPETVRTVAPEAMPGGRFRADGSYLFSGGLGALGLSLAEYFAEHGAGALVLLGRSAPSPEAAARIERLRAGGVRVAVHPVDVADEAGLRAALDTVRAELPPLRGVVHAAGVLDDATVLSLRPEQVARVLAPKVDGARHLDAATADDPLDLFVLFSSVASLVGNPGQAGYAAANAYLDALAEARRRAGRPALAVQWGPFAEVGLAAAEDVRGARLGDRGMASFTTAEAWADLAELLGQDRQVVGYAPLNLRQWFDAYPGTAAQRTWQTLRRRQKEEGVGTADTDFLALFRTTDETTRQELVEARVRENVGWVLRVAPDSIAQETPFKAMGLDSLMSLELRNRLEAAFGLPLSPTLLWTYGNARALSGALSERLHTAIAAG
ncbi:type I polyketide synthase [Streptomyces sp. FH025]|uniref:type I polyketide synthase n=1 Tax=Streptomyces sp. FH025 TaxID=2815937 RepID=UPI001A9F1F05|nr:type I polyketide synthase [Streptomyces sp. FH025]MBO1413052.1 type I polyketide synthase [Streptomyces sp. FH025]